jgi:Leucine-rich repeat (LRR) protein
MLPFQLGELAYLKRLIMNKNYISALPPDLMQCTNMTELRIASNRLAELDHNLCTALCNLVILDVTSNMIAVLPDAVQNLTCIEALMIGNNTIKILPPTMFTMSLLTELGLSGNPLKSPPAELMKLPFPAPLNYLRQIHLAKQSSTLDLTGFLLTAVPDIIQTLVNVSYIRMNSNRLRDFPPSLKVLLKLTKLELVENSFQSLPEEIVAFPHLQTVMLNQNEFLVWPEPISLCTTLTELEFRQNAMKEIPKSIRNLTLLTHLDMTGNEVKGRARVSVLLIIMEQYSVTLYVYPCSHHNKLE